MSDPPQPTPHYGPNNSSDLYLFTFLATLLLLLVISSSIVLRSYILRRQYRSRVEQALRAGIVLTPDAQGSRTKRFGLKPKFHQVWATPGQNARWESIMPISVRKSRRFVNRTPLEPPPSSCIPLWSLSRHFRSNHVSPQTQPSRPPSPQQVETPKKLQVSVLVAMPSPRRPQNTPTTSSTAHGRANYDGDADDDELPDFVIGIAELSYKSRVKKEE